MDARQQLRDRGVAADRIGSVKTNLRAVALDIFDDYDVSIENEEQVIDYLHTHLLETVLDQAATLDEDVADRFELVEDDFANGGSTARSNVTFLVSTAASNEDAPEALTQLSMAFVARNYEHASQSASDE